MFKNIIITICTILVTASSTLANPVPVFCLAGWIDACKGYSRIDEDDTSGHTLKYYRIYNSRIDEDDTSGHTLKYYRIYNSRIDEDDTSGHTLKYYYLR